MIEESNKRIPLHTKVNVLVLDEEGYIYERAVGESGYTVYGVMFSKPVFPKNFGATTVWHCLREDLELFEGLEGKTNSTGTLCLGANRGEPKENDNKSF